MATITQKPLRMKVSVLCFESIVTRCDSRELTPCASPLDIKGHDHSDHSVTAAEAEAHQALAEVADDHLNDEHEGERSSRSLLSLTD